MILSLRSCCALWVLPGLLAIGGSASADAATIQDSDPPATVADPAADPQQPPADQEPLTEDDLTDEELGDDIATITDLATLQEKWYEVDKKLTDAQQRFQATSDAAEQETIRKEYGDLIDRANAVIAQINQVALNEFKNDPNNKIAARLLLGIMMNDAEFNRDSNVMNLGEELIRAGIQPMYFETAAKSDRLSIFSKEMFEELQTRLREATADDLPRVRIVTSKGEIVVELFENEAPNSVANFLSLVEKDFYKDLKFHRVIEGFMAQGGDPDGNGSGGPGYTIKCECNTPDARRHFIGSLSMAHAGKDTGGSQFFLTFKRTTALDGKHTVFGRVIEGMDVLDSFTRTYDAVSNQPLPGMEPDVIKSTEVIRKRNHDYVPVKIGDPEKQPDPPPAQPDRANANDGPTKDSESTDAKKDDVDAAKSEADKSTKESGETSGGSFDDDSKEQDDQNDGQ